MSIADLCVYFLIGILSVAYPILLQVISRLDEKYSSIIIVELFKMELEWSLFRAFLISTLVITGIYSLINLSISLSYIPFINQIVVYGLFISTILLICTFLFFVSKILTYYTPAKIIEYFKGKKETSDYEYFNALGDILYFAIEQQKDVFAREIHDYFYKSFITHRDLADNKEVVYPQPYYELISNTLSKLAPLNNRRFGFLEHRTVGGIWLLGEFRHVKISERTYNQLWFNLITAVSFNRDDMIMQYWPTVHQYYTYQLESIQPDYANGTSLTILNKADIEERNIEKFRFREFNQAVMGLLLYRNRTNCIKRIFNYTSSMPPNYILLPTTMTEVFTIFFKFWDVYESNFPFISSKYWYPETEGINSESLVKLWTAKYAALLFLRQYSIQVIYVYMQPLALPEIPTKKIDRKIWIDNLFHFKRLILEIYGNRELLNAVGLGSLTDEWCKEQGKDSPTEIIDKVQKLVNETYEKTEFEQEVSKGKIEAFNTITQTIIHKAFNPYLESFSNKFDKDFDSYSVRGIMGLMDKGAFVDDQEADYGNALSFYSGIVAEEGVTGLQNTYQMQASKIYYINEAELFNAIDKLGVNPKEFVIVNFGVDIAFLKKNYSLKELSPEAYKGISILTFESNGGSINRGLYILKKTELPYVFSKDLLPEELAKYKAERIDQQTFLYGSIIDLFRDPIIKNEHATEENSGNIDKQVLVYVGLHIVIRWLKGISLINLKIHDQWSFRGMPQTTIEEIEPFVIKKKRK